MTQPAPESHRTRLCAFDTLRGFTVLSMVAFHACYDAAYIYGFSLPWFTGTPLQAVWRSSISWTFLFLAGWMVSQSRSNGRRAVKYGALAMAIWVATSLTAIDTPISFGIMYCMAASTAITAISAPLIRRCRMPVAMLAASLALFALTSSLPRSNYPVEGLAWLGLPGQGFVSGDYYPLLPYGFMYAAGLFAALAFIKRNPSDPPRWITKDWFPPLTAIGRHALECYVIHQPLLLIAFEVFTS